MPKEYHIKRVELVEGKAEELLAKIALILFDHNTRYVKIELESEGTLRYEGKIIKRF